MTWISYGSSKKYVDSYDLKMLFEFGNIIFISFDVFALILRQKGIHLEKLSVWKKNVKKPLFSQSILNIFNLGAILEHQTSNGVFSGP